VLQRPLNRSTYPSGQMLPIFGTSLWAEAGMGKARSSEALASRPARPDRRLLQADWAWR